MSKRPLPLDSPKWTPFAVLHPRLCEQTGSRRCADRDLTEAMANGQVRSMRRRISPEADKPEREQLPPSFWAHHEVNTPRPDIEAALSGEPRSHVVERKPGPSPSLPPENAASRGSSLNGYVFYAWKPDLKKIWIADAAPTEARPPAQEVSVERGRKKVYDRTTLTIIAFALFEHRKQGEPEKIQAEVARELRDWCKRQKEKVPGNTTLNDIVNVAFDARKKWKASLKR